MKKLTVALVATLLFPAAAHASTRGDIAYSANQARHKVVMRHGARAAGRDIVKYGVRFVAADHTTQTRRAKLSELRAYRTQLHRLVAPHPYLSTHAAPPAQAPAGTATAHYAPTGLAACIVQRESGGSPTANNGTHFGIGQWDLQTWQAHHGPEMTGASTPLGASYQAQLQVLNRALAEGKSGAWTPYDGC